jgi:soluble lytic murein transglycosylase-like protein
MTLLRQISTSAAVTSALVLAFAGAAPARAAERILLTNGFEMVCHHHAEVDGRIRVFLKAGTPDYFELKPEAIAGYEAVADPVIEVAPAVAKAVVLPLAEIRLGSAAEAKLTPADLHQLIAQAGTAHNVDADLLASVVKAESGGNARAVSRTGARGLMQLMPGTAKQLGVSDSFAPDQNVGGGTAYLDSLLTRYHDNIALALAAYNAGPEAVDRYHGIPPYHETRAYVARVVHEFNRRVLERKRVAARTRSAAITAGVDLGASTAKGGA